RPPSRRSRQPAPQARRRRPAGARGRRRCGPTSPRAARRPGWPGRSSPASCPRRTISHRTGPHGSVGEKATSSSCNSPAWSPAGVARAQPPVAHYPIAMPLPKPLGLADAAPLGQVLQDRDRLLGGDVGAVQGCPLAFREPRAAGAAPQEPVLFLVPVAAVDHEVLPTADAVVSTRGVQAAEAREVVHDVGNSWVSAVKSATLGNLTC